MFIPETACERDGLQTGDTSAESREGVVTAPGRNDRPHSPLIVQECRVYRGPNLYSHGLVIRVRVDLGSLEEWPSDRISGFTDRLLAIVPTLEEHRCSYGERGGFVRRLREGTWLAHVVEHIAIELQQLVGHDVTFGKTRSVPGEPQGVYDIVYSYKEEASGLAAGLLALRLVQSLLPPALRGMEGAGRFGAGGAGAGTADALAAPLDFAAEIAALKRTAQRAGLGPSTQSIADEARRRGIPIQRLDDLSLLQLGYGSRMKMLRASVTGNTPLIASETAKDKALTSQLLRMIGIPVPDDRTAYTADEAVRAARQLGFPVVVKPRDGNHGRGVSLNLKDEAAVRQAFEEAIQHSRSVIIERFFAGNDYRILVVGGRVVAAAHRVPAHVVGDGRHTLAELVEIVNSDPRRGNGHENVLTRIRFDTAALRLLAARGLSEDSVVADGETVYLQETANLSTGGTAADVLDKLHEDNRDIFERAVRRIGLDVAGLDVVSPDLSRPLSETGGGIIEVNAGPGLRMHLEPSEGRRRNVARPIVNLLFPPGAPTRIPIIAITGTNGKTTTSRMVAHILAGQGLRVGVTTSSGIEIGGRLVQKGDTTGPKSARLVLNDPTVDAAVLETARGGILREGLAWERCDVGAVLNISEDHLGVKGVETVRDLARIKRIVVEAVERNGASVLNADDPLTARMARDAGGRIIYFSMHGGGQMSRHLRRHLEGGGRVVAREDGADGVGGDRLVIYDGADRAPETLMEAREIPATLGGAARFNIANALAATAIAIGAGVPADKIRQGLATFKNDYESNPGRLNVYDAHPFRVILDYAHNPAGMREFGEMVTRLRAEHRRVIGVLTGTGDRRDSDIRELGEIAAGFLDEVILKETTLLRGRKPGEVPRLMREGLLAGGMSPDAISLVELECAAVEEGLRRARPGDLLAVFCDNYATCWDKLVNFKSAAPAPDAAAPRAADFGELDADDDLFFPEMPAIGAGQTSKTGGAQ